MGREGGEALPGEGRRKGRGVIFRLWAGPEVGESVVGQGRLPPGALAVFSFFFPFPSPSGCCAVSQRQGLCMRAAASGAADCFGRKAVP